MKARWWSVLLFGAMATACSRERPASETGTVPPPAVSSTPSSPATASALAAPGTAADAAEPAPDAAQREATFAMRSYSAVVEHGLDQPNASFAYSPLSVAVATAVAYEAARGETQTELGTVLGLSPGETAKAAAFAGLEGLAQPTQPRSDFKIAGGTAMWVAPQIQLAPPFQERLREAYGGGVFQGAPGDDARAARETMNAWIRERTSGGVPQLLPKGSPRPDSRFVLVNALDIQAPWHKPFKKKDTAPRPFTTLEGKTVRLSTMAFTGVVRYARAAAHEAVQLWLRDGEHAMLLIAPHSEQFARVEKEIAAQGLNAIAAQLHPIRMQLWLPKFRVETQVAMKPVLEALGARAAFAGSAADFSGMSENRVFLHQVFHSANLSIDEDGLRASAATALVFPPPAAAPPDLVKFDRPFLFFVRNLKTGVVLFSGRFTGC